MLEGFQSGIGSGWETKASNRRAYVAARRKKQQDFWMEKIDAGYEVKVIALRIGFLQLHGLLFFSGWSTVGFMVGWPRWMSG